MKKLLFLCCIILSGISIRAQVAQTEYKGKKYFVYPLRMDYSFNEDVPPAFINLPDGEYIMFSAYDFKKKLFRNEYKLQDTTGISCIFSLKQQVANGPATWFYNGKKESSGMYLNGVREGVWDYFANGKVISQVTFVKGIENGPYISYHPNGKIAIKGNYQNDIAAGVWEYFNSSGQQTLKKTLTPKPLFEYSRYTVWYHEFIYYFNRWADIEQYQKNHHGEYVYYKNGKPFNRIFFYEGKFMYFDTLKNPKNPRQMIVCTRTRPDLHDTLVNFIFTQTNANGKIVDKKEFSNGNLIYREGPVEIEYHYFGDVKKDTLVPSFKFKEIYNGKYQEGYMHYPSRAELYRYYDAKKNLIQDFKLLPSLNSKDTRAVIIQTSPGNEFELKTYNRINGIPSKYYNVRVVFTDSVRLLQQGKPFTGKIKFVMNSKTYNLLQKNQDGSYVWHIDFDFGYRDLIDEDLSTSFEGTFINGKMQGKWVHNTNGFFRERRNEFNIENDQVNGELLCHAIEGIYSSLRAEARKHGIKKRRIEYLMCRAAYVNGKAHGKTTHYNLFGEKVAEENFVNNTMHGLRTEWENGKIKLETPFVNGLRNGMEKEYFTRVSDQQIKNTTLYKNDTLDIFNDTTHNISYISQKNEFELVQYQTLDFYFMEPGAFEHDNYEERIDSVFLFYKGQPFTGKIKFNFQSTNKVAKNKDGSFTWSHSFYYLRKDNDYYYRDTDIEISFVNGRPEGALIERSGGRFKKCEYITSMHNGLPNGKFTHRENVMLYNGKYSEELFLEEESVYRNGKLHGISTEYNEGKIIAESNYDNGLLHGMHYEFALGARDRILKKVPYTYGILDGKLEEFGLNKKPVFSLSANNGIIYGECLLYSRKGWLQEKLEFNIKDSVAFRVGVSTGRDKTPYPGNKERIRIMNFPSEIYAPYNAINITCNYESYYSDGKLLAKGRIENSMRVGKWEIYNADGIKIHEVDYAPFKDVTPQGKDTLYAYGGKIISYYSNGKKRCEGRITRTITEYDCASDQNKYDFDIIYSNYWNMDGEQVMKNGTGDILVTDEHGTKRMQSSFVNAKPEGIWKAWNPDGTLKELGNHKNGVMEGYWLTGDLSALNYEDNACYDMESEASLLQLNYTKKNININIDFYENGVLIKDANYHINMNKNKEFNKYSSSGYRHRQKF